MSKLPHPVPHVKRVHGGVRVERHDARVCKLDPEVRSPTVVGRRAAQAAGVVLVGLHGWLCWLRWLCWLWEGQGG